MWSRDLERFTLTLALSHREKEDLVVLIERSIDIAAPPEKVWEVMSDVSRWSEWTDSINSAESLDGQGPLQVGRRYKIFQPKLPPAVWKVSALDRAATSSGRATGRG